MTKLDDLQEKGRKSDRSLARNIVIEHTIFTFTDRDYKNYLAAVHNETNPQIAKQLAEKGVVSFARSRPNGVGAMVRTYTKLTIPAADESVIRTLNS